jgi:hypothetical protein
MYFLVFCGVGIGSGAAMRDFGDSEKTLVPATIDPIMITDKTNNGKKRR